MWALGSLAQKAKEAVAQVEKELNESVGVKEDDGGGDKSAGIKENKEGATSTDAPSASSENNSDGDGYLNVEDDEEILFAKQDDEDGNACDDSERWDKCDDANEQKDGTAPDKIDVSTLSEAVSKIKLLEQEVSSLKEELSSARERSNSYKNRNLELEQQLRELTEENLPK
ncbi:predicted protein [Thalassiosira pseudonana CCMP1335]|jgi:hypothetical protein|uniref:Uncharacterized protein n=1 Tax=Thalassiosira pseudonana TaxID=35128 RepID=B8C5I5_THAPS|nr:predicted protein [Thalassiosira pseudonana CCMP1335]EED91513.1 predicted protein [Thalassiosira pseudonana CCMP1335]|eukprot:g4614.t1 g4614   contig15:1394240-1394752(+)